jgi:hypothetical protein
VSAGTRLESGEALEQRRQGLCRLQSRQVRAQAEMPSAAEGLVVGVGALDVEASARMG